MEEQVTNEGGKIEIRVKGLHLSFDDHHVLKDINLEVRQGEMVAIVGRSGCGKTVFLQCLLGHLRPQRGHVEIANHEMNGEPLRDVGEIGADDMDGIRRHWAVVFQRNALLSCSVLDNVGLWLREIAGLEEDEVRRRACEALRAVGFDPTEALLSKQREELSGGMQKRVAVARALAMDPILTFFDEPTTGLDPMLGEQVHELIRTVHERKHGGGIDRTTVIITHDKDLLYRLEPRIVMLHGGRVAFDGDYEAFANADDDQIRPYFDLMPSLHSDAERASG